MAAAHQAARAASPGFARADAPPHRNQAARAHARAGSARRDRAKTINRAGRTRAWREGKAGGCRPPAV